MAFTSVSIYWNMTPPYCHVREQWGPPFILSQGNGRRSGGIATVANWGVRDGTCCEVSGQKRLHLVGKRILHRNGDLGSMPSVGAGALSSAGYLGLHTGAN